MRSQCFSFKSVCRGNNLPLWLKTIKSELAGRETILQRRKCSSISKQMNFRAKKDANNSELSSNNSKFLECSELE